MACTRTNRKERLQRPRFQLGGVNMEYTKTYQIEQALRKSIAADLFAKREKFDTRRDLDEAIKIVERKA
jgi:hypothetical protein